MALNDRLLRSNVFGYHAVGHGNAEMGDEIIILGDLSGGATVGISMTLTGSFSGVDGLVATRLDSTPSDGFFGFTNAIFSADPQTADMQIRSLSFFALTPMAVRALSGPSSLDSQRPFFVAALGRDHGTSGVGNYAVDILSATGITPTKNPLRERVPSLREGLRRHGKL